VSEKPTLVKCLVWDLDNTLWQGTLLEDPDVAVSDEIRNVIAELDSRGILQSVSSKNDYDLAWERLEKLGLAEYFLFPQISWSPKSNAVTRIAQDLNFALGTIAFIDDMPNERAEVTFHAPDVRCYTADQAFELTGLPEFSPEVVTVDARRRRQMYQASSRRDSERETFTGPDEEFLRSLDLVTHIKRADEDDLSRVEELTLRTSQMNATGVHYPDEVLRGLLADPDHEVLTVTMADRFGPHGAVGVMLLEYHPAVWHLRLLATSCRVVSFGAGTVILNWLIDEAAQAGAHLAADFRPTARNRMMDIAYRFAGFADDACTCLDGLGLGGLGLDGLGLGGLARPAEADGEGVQCLHLVPDRRPAPTTLRLISPDLAADRVNDCATDRAAIRPVPAA
jgi:methoxymalonate biosynthesis protein